MATGDRLKKSTVDKLRGEIRSILVRVAKQRGIITYDELITTLKSKFDFDTYFSEPIRLHNVQSRLLRDILNDITQTDRFQNRPAVTSVAIMRTYYLPAYFWFFAQYSISDQSIYPSTYHTVEEKNRTNIFYRIWAEELKRCHDFWQTKTEEDVYEDRKGIVTCNVPDKPDRTDWERSIEDRLKLLEDKLL